jgi:hypothetical protein
MTRLLALLSRLLRRDPLGRAGKILAILAESGWRPADRWER